MRLLHSAAGPRLPEHVRICLAGRGAGETVAELDLSPGDFDIVFAYQWPDEESTITALIERYASVGALLVTYHGGSEFRIRRKTIDQSDGDRLLPTSGVC